MNDMYIIQFYDIENALWTAFKIDRWEEDDVHQLYLKGDVVHFKGIQQLFQDLIVRPKQKNCSFPITC